MDWAKAKNILIVLLLALNLILAVTLVSRLAGGGADRELYASVINILNNRGVTLQCNFPEYTGGGSPLAYGDGARYVDSFARRLGSNGKNTARVELPGREELRYINDQPDEGLATGPEPALDEDVRRLLADWGVDLSGFATDLVSAGDGGGFTLRYIQKFDGKFVFDNVVTVAVTADGGVAGIDVKYREVKPASQDTQYSIMPAYQVVLKNYNESGAVVASIDMGFIGRGGNRDNPFVETEEGAVWRVRLDDGSERFFEAAYGDEIIDVKT